MAEGSEERERDAAEAAKRRDRSDWFGRALGADWVEIEPGIYGHRSPAPTASDESPTADAADATLDQDLLEALPTADRDAEAEPEPSPPPRGPRERRWFRR